MKNPLLDTDFLLALDNQTEHEIYARIIALTMDENPTEEISGKVTQGSINVDGSSAVRRTCSLTLVAKDININDFYWGQNTKFKLFIGLKNNVNPEYDDIIWFKQGIYLITTFNTAVAANSYTINISGKDKLCLLNGDVGGMIHDLSVDFGSYDETDSAGNVTNKKYPIKDIIREAVHHYAGEPYHNIILSDLDEAGLELLEYRGDIPMYILFNQNSDEATNIRFEDGSANEYYVYDNAKYYKLCTEGYYDSEKQYFQLDDEGVYHGVILTRDTYLANTYYIYDDDIDRYTKVKITLDDPSFVYDTRLSSLDFNGTGLEDFTHVWAYEENTGTYGIYTVSMIENGDTCGYRYTDLVYAGDLIGAAGNSITTTVLDKIVKMLGEYEYFYDVDGHFNFQKKRTYVNTYWNNIVNNRDTQYVDNAAYTSALSYSFIDSKLVQTFSNQPDLSSMKNDFSIWGTRTTADGYEVPVHLRYAIDLKPNTYVSYDGYTYTTGKVQSYSNWIAAKKATIIADIQSEQQEAISNYTKAANPNGLSSDWWEIVDWATYYHKITGEWPSGNIGQYANEGKGKVGALTTSEIGTELFETAETGPYAGVSNGLSYIQIVNYPVYIFDIDYTTRTDGKPAWGYAGHGTSCSHSYTYFTNRTFKYQKIEYMTQELFEANYYPIYIKVNDEYIVASVYDENTEYYRSYGTSYIYKPTIPTTELAAITEGEVEERLVDDVGIITSEEVYNQYFSSVGDWREILYQMALDYYKYQHNEDFLAVIAQNNPDDYPLGTTGYENYYTDMEGFWRELYDPTITPIDIENTEPDSENTNFYFWDTNFKKFTDYTFNQATEIKKITSVNENVYYYDGSNYYQYSVNPSSCYDFQEVKDLSTLDNTLTYYYQNNEGVWTPVTETTTVEEKTQPIFVLGRKYYILAGRNGYVKVNSFHQGDTIDNYYTYDTATDTYNLFISLTNSSIQYYASVNNVWTKTTTFTRGESYYTYDGANYNFAFKLDKGVIYYQYKGYVLTVDLSEYTPDNYYYNLNDLSTRVYQFAGGYQYCGYLKVSSPVNQAQYYVLENGKFVKRYILLNFLRGYNYYVYTYGYDKVGVYDTVQDTSIYYIKKANGTYVSASSLIKAADRTLQGKLTTQGISDLYDDYGLVVDQTSEKITALDHSKVFYYYQQAYRPYNYYVYAFYQKATSYSPGVQYYGVDSNYNYVALNVASENDFNQQICYTKIDTSTAQIYTTNEYNPETHWNVHLDRPEELNFWIDFLDVSGGELAPYAVRSFGCRPKAIKDNDVKAIYYRDTPTVIFLDEDEEIDADSKQSGYTYIRLTESLENLFAVSAQGKTAFDLLSDNLYNHAYCTEKISLTTVPIYYLEPNTRIFVNDSRSNIEGEYLITKLTIPLQYNGMMTITASRAVERIL